MILLQPGGENSIVLVPGANADWPEGWETTLLPAVAKADVVLLQREVPDAVNTAVARHAKVKTHSHPCRRRRTRREWGSIAPA